MEDFGEHADLRQPKPDLFNRSRGRQDSAPLGLLGIISREKMDQESVGLSDARSWPSGTGPAVY
jgi:hypothetical protein